MAAERLSFPWTATGRILHRLWKLYVPVPDPQRGCFVCDDPELVCTPPLVQRPGPEDDTLAAYLDRLDHQADDLGLQVVLLMRAGISALGLWRSDELLAHKVIRKYVVRGSGRAQTTHLKTRGKSRYGSRLRLQGARAQLQETNQRLLDWRAEFGRERHLLVSAPVRLLADLKSARPTPPDNLAQAARIPFPTRAPTHAELLRARRLSTRGSVVGPAEILEVLRSESI